MQNLSLSDNLLKSSSELKHLEGLKLRELRISGNPVILSHRRIHKTILKSQLPYKFVDLLFITSN